jgi:hypothetical protein
MNRREAYSIQQATKKMAQEDYDRIMDNVDKFGELCARGGIDNNQEAVSYTYQQIEAALSKFLIDTEGVK